MKKFRKRETGKYDWTINYIREEMKDGRDFWASLGSAGLTFQDDIRRFTEYARQMKAMDIVNEILEEHPEYI